MPRKTKQPNLLSPAEWACLPHIARSAVRVREWLRAGRVPGAISHGTGNRTIWEIPEGALKPMPGRPGRPSKMNL